MIESLHDLAAVDRDVATVRSNLAKARGILASGGTPHHPFEPLRYVSQQRTFDALRELPVSALDAPLRDALVTSVASLVLARTGWALEEETSTRANRVPDDEGGEAISYAEALHRFQLSADPRRLEAALETWVRRAVPVAAVNDERRARSFEVARLLGFDHPLGPMLPVPPRALSDAARSFLHRTSDLAQSIRKRTHRADGISLPIATVLAAHAVEGADGWPKHVSGRFLEEAFSACSPDLNRVPVVTKAPVSPASFARSAEHAGVYLRESLTPRSLPFALRSPPLHVDAWRWGSTFASCLARETFHQRVLGAPKGRALDQSRRVAEGLFWSLRIRAAELVCDLSAHVHPSEFEELTGLAFGASLPSALRGAWPSPGTERAPRFLGSLLALEWERHLIERFDLDWFRNPRCGTFLRAQASGVGNPSETVDLMHHVGELTRHVEQVLA